MTKPAVMIYGPIAARAVSILTENIRRGTGTGTEEGTGIGIEKEKEKGIVIGIEKDTRNGSGIETETEQGRELGIRKGSERKIENAVLIMIEGPNIQREIAEETNMRVAVMAVDITVGVGVGAAVGAGVEVGACKLALHFI